MKKILTTLVIACMMLSMAGCGYNITWKDIEPFLVACEPHSGIKYITVLEHGTRATCNNGYQIYIERK